MWVSFVCKMHLKCKQSILTERILSMIVNLSVHLGEFLVRKFVQEGSTCECDWVKDR